MKYQQKHQDLLVLHLHKIIQTRDPRRLGESPSIHKSQDIAAPQGDLTSPSSSMCLDYSVDHMEYRHGSMDGKGSLKHTVRSYLLYVYHCILQISRKGGCVEHPVALKFCNSDQGHFEGMVARPVQVSSEK